MICLRHDTPREVGKDAARLAAMKLNLAIEGQGSARLVLSTGASQFETLEALVKADVDWSKVEMFHLDEYVGLPETHPASFRKYLKERFVNLINLKKAYFVDGDHPEETIKYLTEEITKAPIDVALIGVGENAHIAFNDPPADFDTQESFVIVDLDEKCRMQQVGEGWFKNLDDVPKQAVSMTPYRIMESKTIISAVPHKVKESAIRLMMENDVTNEVPATLLKRHSDMYLIVDKASAGDTFKSWWSYTLGKDDFQFIQLSSLEKVFLDEKPKATELNEISILKNERLSYQIAYSHIGMPVGDACVYPFKVTVNSPLAKYIKFRRVGNVPVELSYYKHACDNGYLRKGPGLYPDQLCEMEENVIEVIPTLWHSFWVTVDTKGEVPGGCYEIELIFEYKSHLTGEILRAAKTLKVKIVDAMMPKQETVVGNWFHTDCLASVYGVKMYSEKHWQIIENFMRCAIENGVNSIYTPIFSIPLDTNPEKKRPACQLVDIWVNHGEYTFGFDKLRRWISIFKKLGGDYLEMSHLFSQWGAKFAPRIIAKVNGRNKEIFGWHTSVTSPEYKQFLQLCLPQLVQVLKEEGVAEVTRFHISDEPHMNTLESYRAAKDIVASALKGFEIIEACSEVEVYESGAVEYPIIEFSFVESYRAEGITPFGAYFCCSTSAGDYCNRFIDMPSYRCRVMGANLFKYNIRGLFHFGFNYYFKREKSGGTSTVINPMFMTDAGNAIQGGNGFVVYPGEDGQPIESIRLSNTYDALQDIRAMKLLESYIGHEEVVKLIEDCAKMELKFNVYPKNAEFLLEMRKRINEKIEEMI